MCTDGLAVEAASAPASLFLLIKWWLFGTVTKLPCEDRHPQYLTAAMRNVRIQLDAKFYFTVIMITTQIIFLHVKVVCIFTKIKLSEVRYYLI